MKIVVLCERSSASRVLAFSLPFVDRSSYRGMGHVFLLVLNLTSLGSYSNARIQFAVCRFGNLAFGLLHLPSQVRIHHSYSEQLAFTIS